MTTNPLEDGSLENYSVHAIDLTVADGRVGQGVRAVPQGRLPGEEHVLARSAVVAVRAARSSRPRRSWRKRFASKPDIRDANLAAFKRRLELR